MAFSDSWGEDYDDSWDSWYDYDDWEEYNREPDEDEE